MPRTQDPIRVVITYKVKLTPLGDTAEPVCGDDGEPIVQEVLTDLSYPKSKLSRRVRDDAAKAAFVRATRLLNRGHKIRRDFQLVECSPAGERTVRG